MLKKSKVLKWEKSAEQQSVKLEWIDNTCVPETLNSESGFHIYHVCILTELLLKQLKKQGYISLSEEDIEAITLAASLHDIGKSQISQKILHFPGKLSPIEYDIVKKHAVFGEELIKETDFGDLDPKIRQYALEITRWHHERYDGTGYPDGLKADAIPLSAQVVAIADSYDALTSQRSYKEAFSQDVAVQMISSGLCGVFEEKLVNSLLKIVNHSTLETLREILSKRRAIVTDEDRLKVERVLFIGNTQYITKEFIESTFPDSKVMVVGNTELGSADKIKLFRIKKPSIKTIFETYDFDLIVFFSGELTFQSTEKNDSEELREVLKFAGESKKDINFMFLSSLDTAFARKTDRSIIAAAKESLCEFYAKEKSLDVKIVQIPYLYSGSCEHDFLYKIFDHKYQKKTFSVDAAPAQNAHFISMQDLSQLLIRLVDNWKSGSGTLTVGDDFQITFADLGKEIAKVCGFEINYSPELPVNALRTTNKALRNEYGWFAKVSLLDDMEEEYEKFLDSKRVQAKTKWDKFKQWMAKHSLLVKITELILLFLFTELLVRLTDSAVIFSIVDFRMAYIVIMATVHGLNFGLAAAGISSFSWLFAKISSGTSFMTVFYEPNNWLPFVFFMLVGTVCGYVKLRKDDTIRFVTEQNHLLEDKLVFTRELYEDAYREKRDLKKQIIGSKDSFGKIFDITRRLDTVELHMLYLRIMETFEEILENKTIMVYSINKQNAFGRLEVASRDIIDTVPRSISVEAYAPVIDALNAGEVWRNIDLRPEFPMYAAGVYRGKELIMLIFIWHTGIDQRSLYYVNLFKILRDLVQMSLLRVYDYNQAIEQKQYIENTHIMNADAFEKHLQNFTALAEKKVFSYVLLELEREGRSMEQMEALLLQKIRANDTLGVGRDGKLRLLLSGATEKDLPAILPRFERLGLKISVIQ